jgi:hypothetical protein
MRFDMIYNMVIGSAIIMTLVTAYFLWVKTRHKFTFFAATVFLFYFTVSFIFGDEGTFVYRILLRVSGIVFCIATMLVVSREAHSLGKPKA